MKYLIVAFTLIPVALSGALSITQYNNLIRAYKTNPTDQKRKELVDQYKAFGADLDRKNADNALRVILGQTISQLEGAAQVVSKGEAQLAQEVQDLQARLKKANEDAAAQIKTLQEQLTKTAGTSEQALHAQISALEKQIKGSDESLKKAEQHYNEEIRKLQEHSKSVEEKVIKEYDKKLKEAQDNAHQQVKSYEDRFKTLQEQLTVSRQTAAQPHEEMTKLQEEIQTCRKDLAVIRGHAPRILQDVLETDEFAARALKKEISTKERAQEKNLTSLLFFIAKSEETKDRLIFDVRRISNHFSTITLPDEKEKFTKRAAELLKILDSINLENLRTRVTQLEKEREAQAAEQKEKMEKQLEEKEKIQKQLEENRRKLEQRGQKSK